MSHSYLSVEKEGKIAVIISIGYGAGWSTWGGMTKETKQKMLFHPDLVALIQDGTISEYVYSGDNITAAKQKILKVLKRLSLPTDLMGIDELVIEWVPIGTRFIIDEYDGAETLRIFEELDIWEA